MTVEHGRWRRVSGFLLLVGVVVSLGVAAAASAGSGAPVNTALPVISGSLVQGQSLSSSTGEWAGTQPISFAYQWQRCDQSGGGCTDIAGATAPSYLLTAADTGHRLRVGVGASNSAGAAAVLSIPTGIVAAAPTTTTTTTTSTSTPSPVPTKASCKHDGWRTFTSPRFHNQGQCLSFFEHQHHHDHHHGRHDNQDSQGTSDHNKQGDNNNQDGND
jgi:hypothetical protein